MQQGKPLVSVTAKDLIRQTFCSGGKGGQNQNKRETGVRFIHAPSGARGEARDSRNQERNVRSAFHRLVNTPAFIKWIKAESIKAMGTQPRATKEEILAMIDLEFINGNVKEETYAP